METGRGVRQPPQTHTRPWRGRIYLTLVCVLLMSVQAGHAVMLPMGLNSLASQADTVVLGTVTRQVSAWDAQYTAIYTEVTVVVEQAILGTPGAEVTFQVAGGTVGTVGMRTSNDAVFHDGERVIVCLDMATVPGRIVGMRQGKTTVRDNMVIHDGKPMALEDFIAAIRTAARR